MPAVGRPWPSDDNDDDSYDDCDGDGGGDEEGRTVMMLTPGNAVVQHGEDEEDGVEAGKDHQEVVEGVSHAED